MCTTRCVTCFLLANLLLQENDPERLSYTELDHFAHSLDSLSIGAIRTLGEVHRMSSSGIGMFSDQSFRFNFEDLQRRLVGELNAMNLVHLAGVPSIRTSEYGNYPIELTPLGTRFLTHVLRAQPTARTTA